MISQNIEKYSIFLLIIHYRVINKDETYYYIYNFRNFEFIIFILYLTSQKQMKKFLKKGPKNSSSGSDERSESEDESKTSPSGSP